MANSPEELLDVPVGAVPVVVTARLQHGVSMHRLYGIALDGLLTSVIRDQQGYSQAQPPSVLDGGLHGDEVVEYALPLGRCLIAGEQWHWLASNGELYAGEVLADLTPDMHQLLQRVDDTRAESTTVALPKNLGGARGRFRNRVTPVITVPATHIVWHAVAVPEALQALLEGIPAIGARRGTGEGTVLSWTVETAPLPGAGETLRHGHLHPSGRLGRPSPVECATYLKVPMLNMGIAALRPPMFLMSRQQTLVLPEN